MILAFKNLAGNEPTTTARTHTKCAEWQRRRQWLRQRQRILDQAAPKPKEGTGWRGTLNGGRGKGEELKLELDMGPQHIPCRTTVQFWLGTAATPLPPSGTRLPIDERDTSPAYPSCCSALVKSGNSVNTHRAHTHQMLTQQISHKICTVFSSGFYFLLG